MKIAQTARRRASDPTPAIQAKRSDREGNRRDDSNVAQGLAVAVVRKSELVAVEIRSLAGSRGQMIPTLDGPCAFACSRSMQGAAGSCPKECRTHNSHPAASPVDPGS
jgi:hypothetical protein